MICIKALVSGKVQGVFFRAFTKKVADELQLTGWVKNLSDGRVEVMVCGSQETLQKFLDVLRQGPPSSKVSDVCWEEVSEQTFTEFTINR
jgi:acylphosphatase